MEEGDCFMPLSTDLDQSFPFPPLTHWLFLPALITVRIQTNKKQENCKYKTAALYTVHCSSKKE
jgi:hypothetical protein